MNGLLRFSDFQQLVCNPTTRDTRCFFSTTPQARRTKKIPLAKTRPSCADRLCSPSIVPIRGKPKPRHANIALGCFPRVIDAIYRALVQNQASAAINRGTQNHFRSDTCFRPYSFVGSPKPIHFRTRASIEGQTSDAVSQHHRNRRVKSPKPACRPAVLSNTIARFDIFSRFRCDGVDSSWRGCTIFWVSGSDRSYKIAQSKQGGARRTQ